MSRVQAFAEVNGTRLSYEIVGSGTPIVLIHGLGSDLRFWNNQFGAFAKRHLVVRYDLRGHGKSNLPSGESYSHSDDLGALLDHLGISRVHLIGQSLGGEIAIDFALSYPEKVMRLVLTDSSLNGHQWSTAWGESWLPIIEAAPSGREAWLPLVLAHPMFEPGLRQPSVRAGLTELFSSYTAWHFMNADPVVKSDPPASQRLGDIQVPSLVLVGELEPPDFRAISKLLEKKIPNVQKIEFGDTGHVLPMEAPEKFNEVVLEFLAVDKV
jgi:pimeloyl-ACP methyl ester carboxylesterase